jgi:hypothetical protein
LYNFGLMVIRFGERDEDTIGLGSSVGDAGGDICASGNRA